MQVSEIKYAGKRRAHALLLILLVVIDMSLCTMMTLKTFKILQFNMTRVHSYLSNKMCRP